MGKTEDKGTVITCPLEDLRPRRAEQSLGLAGAGQAGLGHGTSARDTGSEPTTTQTWRGWSDGNFQP